MLNLSHFLIQLFLLQFSVSGDFLSKFRQNQYKLKDFRGELEYYNKSMVNFASVITYKYNRSTPLVNVTINFKVSVEDKVQLRIQVYKFASNEYRRFPILFQINQAEALEANIGGIRDVLTCGNFEPMYFVKDITYVACNFYIDETKLPPLIPTGKYKARMELLYFDSVFAIVCGYEEVYVPIKIPG